MNKVIESGRLTGDPHVRYTAGSNSTCVADFNIAVNRKFKRDGAPEADFFNCTAFGKTAESVEKFLTKGTKVIITGSIQNDNYEKDGVRHYQVKIIVDDWEFAESKKAAGEEPANGETGFVNIPDGIDDNMPFK